MLSPRMKTMLLVAPAAIAKAIVTMAPELMEKGTVKILIPGTEWVDRLDEGKWYQLIGWMLGKPDLKIEVTNVGPSIGRHDGIKSPPSSTLVLNEEDGFLRSKTSAMWLGQHLDIDQTQYDMAILFNPGFSEFTEWFLDDGLGRLIDTGIPVFATAYEISELPDDIWVAGIFGIGRKGDHHVQNVFCVGPAQDNEAAVLAGDSEWGKIIWQMRRVSTHHIKFHDMFVKAAEYLRREARMANRAGPEKAKLFLQTMSQSGVHLGLEKAPLLPGVDGKHELYTLPRSLAVVAGTGQVFDLEKNELVADVHIPQDVIDAFPSEARDSKHHYPGVLWSIWVFQELVLTKLKR